MLIYIDVASTMSYDQLTNLILPAKASQNLLVD